MEREPEKQYPPRRNQNAPGDIYILPSQSTLPPGGREKEKKLRRTQREEKILEHQIKTLTRKERTHRLCTRAATRVLRPAGGFLRKADDWPQCSGSCQSSQGKLNFPCADCRQLPLCGLTAREHLALQAVPVRQVLQ